MIKKKNTFGRQAGTPKAKPEPNRREPKKVQFGRQAPDAEASRAPLGLAGFPVDMGIAVAVLDAYNACTDRQKQSMKTHMQKAMEPVLSRLDDDKAEIVAKAFDMAGQQFADAAEAAAEAQPEPESDGEE